MIRRTVFLVLFFGVTPCVAAGEISINFSDPMFSRLDAEGKNLLTEYAKAYPKIKDFYENMRMDVNVKNTNYTVNLESLRSTLRSEGLGEDEIKDIVARSGKTDIQYEVRYRQQDNYFRVDTKVNHIMTDYARARLPHGSPIRNFANGDIVPDVGTVLLTPTTGYQFSKKDPSKQFPSLNARRDLKKPGSEDDIGLPLIYVDTAPFCVDAMPLENIVFQCPPLIKGKPYVVDYIRQKEVDGRPVVEIRTSRADLTDSFREIKLDKNSWGILEIYARSGLTLPSGEREIQWTREICTYDGVVDGVPLLKTYHRSFGKRDKNSQEDRMISQMSCEVTHLVLGAPDLSEFDVAQFLPPGVKVGEITPARLSTARIVTIVISIILIILGIYLKIRNARKE